MAGHILWPRLDRLAVGRLLEVHGNASVLRPYAELPPLPEESFYASVGGSPIGRKVLTEFRKAAVGIANEHGFGSDRIDKSKFDAEMAAFLVDFSPLDSGEALRDDMWACVASSILRDITLWRFGNSRARWHGGVRNTFQRLWLRGRTFDLGRDHPDRWLLLNELTEDALVQIEERPALGAYPRLAQAIAQGWVRASKQVSRSQMETIMRDAIIGIRLRNTVIMLVALKPSALRIAVDAEFASAIQRHQADLDSPDKT